MSWLLPLLSARIRQMRAMGERVPTHAPKSPDKWAFPWADEQRYSRKITEFLTKFTETLDLSRYPEWLASTHRDDESFSTGWARSLEALRKAQKELFDGYEAEALYGMIFEMGQDVSRFNMEEWKKHISAMVGHDFYPMDYPGVAETFRAWSDENFELIRSLTDTYIGKVNTIVSQGIRNGVLYRDLMDQIRALDHNITYNRAKLIARDQVGKLNGELARRRQIDAGVDSYIWETAGDERVRGNPRTNPNTVPSHYLMDRLRCRWDDSSVYWSGSAWIPRTARMSPTHPSREIQCRCVGIPYMEDLWQEAKQAA